MALADESALAHAPESQTTAMRRFTIITVTKDAGTLLADTVNSVLRQSHANWELIIKDGCSTDGSLEALPKDPRIRLISKPDAGVYSAMNQALEFTTGDVVNFLNAGDCYCDQDVLSRVDNTFDKSNADLAWGDYRAMPAGLIVRQPCRLSRWFLFRNNICHQTQFISRESLLSVAPFDDSFRLLGDIDLFLRLLFNNDVRYAHTGSVLVNEDMGGLTSQPANDRLARDEHRVVQSRHFGRAERLFFRALQFMSLKGLRISIARGRAGATMQRLYRHAVNLPVPRPADPTVGTTNPD